MGRPPAYIFVVRHGARLDQADKKWHLSSPTPYDPPLTYGGWLQAQAAGARIAAILRQAQEDAGNDSPTAPSKKRKFKIVVHSSPFLRCIQTSVAISAGLAHAVPQASATTPYHLSSTAPEKVNPLSADPSVQPLSGVIQKTPIRVDAFLGEWLNPEYFEAIARPPSSQHMLGTAKVALLRHETISAYESSRPHASSMTSLSYGQLWSSPKMSAANERASSVDSNSPLGLDGLPAMASALPRNRAGSANSASSSRRSTSPDDGYVAPTPNYAISTSGKIPDGYVAHARDACAVADYQWDSMQEPLNWGDGGVFGEEWISMHRRFRAGFQKLVDWYATAESPAELVTKTVRLGVTTTPHAPVFDDADDDAEAVVILVSHGAGCNAMIGVITRQPVLMDVGVATVTMAARKDNVDGDAPIVPFSDPSAPMVPGKIPIDQYYDLKIQASNDHLRNMSSTGGGLSRAASTSSAHVHTPHPQARGRVSTMSSATGLGFHDFDLGGSRSNSANANLASMRRTSYTTSPMPRGIALNTTGITVGSGATTFSQPVSTGLWSPSSPVVRRSESDDDDLFPDFDGRRFAAPKAPSPELISPSSSHPLQNIREEQPRTVRSPHRLQEISRPPSRDGDDRMEEAVQAVPVASTGAGGLWGA
ncbi:hypothetical protein HYQ44_009687 [Verticillium longisporum]|nr:hypothetical protein HYQ44_009687 [Verticillium longisporum]